MFRNLGLNFFIKMYKVVCDIKVCYSKPQTEKEAAAMDYSRKIAERLWNMPDKGELESHREETFIDDIIQKSHIEKELAEKEGVLDKIIFVNGALENLSDFKDKSFDMVISFDAPVSYTYPNQKQVIGELIRICRKRIMISVSSRLGYLPYLANPIQKNQFILDAGCDDPFVKWCIDNKANAIEAFHFSKEAVIKLWNEGLMGGDDEIAEYESGGVPWCITYTFMPDELKDILKRHGVKNIQLAGPGAYARTLPNELLVKIMKDSRQRSDFLDFCHCYDSNPFVCGMGKDNLLAQGEL